MFEVCILVLFGKIEMNEMKRWNNGNVFVTCG